MQSENVSRITRRSLLASLGGVAGASTVIATKARADDDADSDARPRNLSEVQREFERLLPLGKKNEISLRIYLRRTAIGKGPMERPLSRWGHPLFRI